MEIPDHMESSAHHRNALALWSWGVAKGLLLHVFGYQIGIYFLLLSSCKGLLIFRLLFLVNKIRGTHIVDLCLLFMLPFTSFVGHFIHHPHLEINQSIVTSWTTTLMPVEACRVRLTIDCDWVPPSWEDDSPGFKQRSLTSSDVSCQKGNLVSKEDVALVTLIDADTVAADEGSSVEGYIQTKMKFL